MQNLGAETALAQRVRGLDLGPIKYKLVLSEEGPHWPREKADRVESEYRKFLILCGEHKDLAIVPSKDVDVFWHNHILDTRKYAADCAELFGFFLHHFPYFGERGAEDRKNLKACYERTSILMQENFGSIPGSSETALCGPANCDGGANCAPDAIHSQVAALRPSL
jgi:hypothetical protein